MSNINYNGYDEAKKYLEFLEANGFKPENYDRVLELWQSVPNSMSQHLGDFNPFLLSKAVEYQKLSEYDIKGAKGELTNYGIWVPKTLEGDEYFNWLAFNGPKIRRLPGTPIGYKIPNVNNFDAMIAYQKGWNDIYGNQLVNLRHYPQHDQYFGFMAKEDDLSLISGEAWCFAFSLRELMLGNEYDYICDKDGNTVYSALVKSKFKRK